MKKYDCEKTRDFMHEWVRYHKASGNDKFPIITSWEPASIEVLQRWSDEHPEPAKLTERDYSFLDCFGPMNKYIKRQYGVLSVIWNDPVITTGPMEIPIDATMFKCVERGQKWSFDDLRKLEVEDE